MLSAMFTTTLPLALADRDTQAIHSDTVPPFQSQVIMAINEYYPSKI
jgi:hypothetical protein